MSYDSLDCRAVAQTLWGMLFFFFFYGCFLFFMREIQKRMLIFQGMFVINVYRKKNRCLDVQSFSPISIN